MFKLYLFRLSLFFAVMIAPAMAGAADGHRHHDARHVSPSAPPVSLILRADPAPSGGYNLHLEVTNFRFSPENLDQETNAVEGHAHLFINMKKIGRIFEPHHHVPAELLGDGANNIRVILNDNFHRPWKQDGKWIGASLHLMGKGAVNIDRVIDLAMPQSAMQAETVIAIQGETVRLNVAAKPEQQMHLHGYDLHLMAGADGRVSLVVTLEHSGRFPIVIHAKDSLLGMTESAFAYLEVRSK